MDDRFTQAIKTSILEMEVCGRKLKPICLRHTLILTEIESPAIFTNKVMSPQDLVLACRILSTYDLREMLSIKANDIDSQAFLLLLTDNAKYNEELKKFCEYLKFQDNAPVLWEKKSNGNGRGVGTVLSCVSNLIRNGIDYEKAWTMPESEAVWLYVANTIAAGADINVVDDRDKAAMEMLNKMNIPKKK